MSFDQNLPSPNKKFNGDFNLNFDSGEYDFGADDNPNFGTSEENILDQMKQENWNPLEYLAEELKFVFEAPYASDGLMIDSTLQSLETLEDKLESNFLNKNFLPIIKKVCQKKLEN